MIYSIKLKNLSKRFRIKHENENILFNYLKNFILRKNNYETFSSLKNINLKIKKGDFVGIVGPNGAGKTTLLQIITGTLIPSKGSVFKNGSVLPIIDLGSDINPDLTGRENIFLSGTIIGLSRKNIEKNYDYIVDFSGLGKFIDVKTKRYSNGMKLRLAFSIMLLVSPDVLLIDEVFNVGDISFQKKCADKLKEFSYMGKTILFVSQNPNVIKSFCNKALFLDAGSIVSFGNVDKVLSQFVNKYSKIDSLLVDTRKNNLMLGLMDRNTDNLFGLIIKSINIIGESSKSNIIQSGENILIRIDFDSDKKIINPVFGVAVYTSKGELLFGPNTMFDNFKIPFIEGKGQVVYKIKKNNFLSGKYYVSVAIHTKNSFNPIAYVDKNNYFSIISDDKTLGVIKFKSEWNILI